MPDKKISKEREEASLGLGLFDEEEIEATKVQTTGKSLDADSAEKKQRKTREKTKTMTKGKGETKARNPENGEQLGLFSTSRRGGARPGAGRPRGNKHPWSLRVTEEEKAALKSMLIAMRGSQ